MYDRFSHSHCTDEDSCPGGNCTGCKSGRLWCFDPRCFPHCNDCPYPEERDRIVNMVIFIILVALVAIAVLIAMGFGGQIAYYYVPRGNLGQPETSLLVDPTPFSSPVSFELPPPMANQAAGYY